MPTLKHIFPIVLLLTGYCSATTVSDTTLIKTHLTVQMEELESNGGRVVTALGNDE